MRIASYKRGKKLLVVLLALTKSLLSLGLISKKLVAERIEVNKKPIELLCDIVRFGIGVIPCFKTQSI